MNGGTLDLGGFNIGSLSAPITNVFASGTLKNVGQLNGGGALTKTTAGMLTLGGASTYTGSTIVSAGTLAINGSILGSTNLVVTGGTLLLSNGVANSINDSTPVNLAGGTLALTGTASETAGVLICGAGTSIMDFGAGSGILNFADSSSAAWAGNLQIINWSGSTNGGGTDRLFVGSTSGGLTPAQLQAIVFVNPMGTNGNFGAAILSSGEVVPNITLNLNDTWKQTAGATWDWNDAANWLSGISYPNRIGSLAILSTNIAGNQIINLNTNITVGTLVYGDTTTPFGTMTINSNNVNGTLTFDVSYGSALLARAATNSPGLNDVINANMVLNKPLAVRLPWLNSANGIVISNAISGAGGITLIATNMPIAATDNAQLLDLVNTNSSFSGPVEVANGYLNYRGSVLSGQNSALGNSTGAVRISSPLSLSTNTAIPTPTNSYAGVQTASTLKLIASDDSSNYGFTRDLDFSGSAQNSVAAGGRSQFFFASDGAGGVNSNTLTLGGVVTLTSSNRGVNITAYRSLMSIYFTNNIQNGTNSSGSLYLNGSGWPGSASRCH